VAHIDDYILDYCLRNIALAVGTARDIVAVACTRCGARDVAIVALGYLGRKVADE
jgi:hypothetical protein